MTMTDGLETIMSATELFKKRWASKNWSADITFGQSRFVTETETGEKSPSPMKKKSKQHDSAEKNIFPRELGTWMKKHVCQVSSKSLENRGL